jgi:two-component system, LytTR family, response regulator LytT
VNILICSSVQKEMTFLYEHLQTFFAERGIEPIILSFPNIDLMTEYLSVSPDIPDAVFLSFPVINLQVLNIVQQFAEGITDTQIILIGDSPADVERMFSLGIFYFFYPDITSENFHYLENKMARAWFSNAEKYFLLENKKNTLKIAYSDILYVMSDKRKAIIYQPNGRTDSLYCKLDAIEQQLDDRFIRCHQSYLINVQYIRGIDVDGFLMIDNIFIPISQKKYWASKRRYIQFIKEQG